MLSFTFRFLPFSFGVLEHIGGREDRGREGGYVGYFVFLFHLCFSLLFLVSWGYGQRRVGVGGYCQFVFCK